MHTIPEGEWQLECTGELFADLRSDKEFAFLVTLARIVNALKFGVDVHRSGGDERTPTLERRRVGALLYLAGILHEVIQLRNAAEKQWGEVPGFKEVFGVLDESKVDSETADVLHRIRNRAAFHFDTTVAVRSLPELPAEAFTFIAALGRDPMDSNYELADLVTFGFIFEAPADVQRLSERLARFRKSLDTLLGNFVRQADRFIINRLLARGFTINEVAPGTFASDREPESPPKGVA
jgi:hypothetical protein